MIYRQFSITLAAAMLLSLLVAMFITPALCAVLLKKQTQKPKWGQNLRLCLKKLKLVLVF